MNEFYKNSKYLRKYFGKPRIEIEMPVLCESYKNSFNTFLQVDREPILRESKGLQKIFQSVFPIEIKRLSNYSHIGYRGSINYRDIYFYSHYIIMPTSYSEEECILKGLSYITTIYIVTYKLTLREDKLSEEMSKLNKIDINSLEKHIFVFPIKGFPLITDKGTFIINGIERAIVSQLQRNPGLYYFDNKKNSIQGLKIIPYYGPKIELEEKKSDRYPFEIRFFKKKIPFWIFLESLGVSIEEIISIYCNTFFVLSKHNSKYVSFNLKNLWNGYVWKDIKNPTTHRILFKSGEIISLQKLKFLYSCKIKNNILNQNLYSLKSNFTYNINLKLNKHYYYDSSIHKFTRNYIEKQRSILFERFQNYSSTNSIESFNFMLQKITRNNLYYTKDDCNRYFQKTLFSSLYYNMSAIGRSQLNYLFNYPNSGIFNYPILTKLDLLSFINYHLCRKNKLIELDNLYNIQNRKVRLAAELFGHLIFKTFVNIKKQKNYFGKATLFGITRWKISHQLPLFIKKRISQLFDIFNMLAVDTHILNAWINNKIYILSDVGEKLYKFILYQSKQEIDQFLTGSNLSQLLDKLNPLAELTHLRRVSLLGPDGLQRENVSMDTRDVQFSYFGRICPIETPEGKSVGIVNSLTTLTSINNDGNVTTPYISVKKGQLQNIIYYLDGKSEYNSYIALSEVVKSDGCLPENELIYCRYQGSYLYVNRNQVNYVDVAPFHILSISAGLIPFIEHNDGNRALMGANMQRQAVAPIISEVPFIATGLEYIAGRESSILHTENSVSLLIDNTHLFLTLNDAIKTKNRIYYSTILEHSITNTLLQNISRHPYKNINQLLFGLQSNLFSLNLPIKKYCLSKYEKNSQKTYTHYQTSKRKAELISNKSILANNHGVSQGEISIGHNILIGFMSMNGYSFEDSIVISDRLHKDGLFNSIHTKEFVAFDWETYKTKERITRKIPNISPKYLEHLDSSGVVRVSTSIKGNSILVGKILIDRKDKSLLSDRDKFLQLLIAGEGENRDFIKNTSKRTPKDIEGYVIDVKKYFFSTGSMPELIFKREKNNLVSNYYFYKNNNWILDQYFVNQISDYLTTFFYKIISYNHLNDFTKDQIQLPIDAFKAYLKELKIKDSYKKIENIDKTILAFLVYFKNKNLNISYKDQFTKCIIDEKLWRVFNRYTRFFVKIEKLNWTPFFIKLLNTNNFVNILTNLEYISIKKLIISYIFFKIKVTENFLNSHLEQLKKMICYNAPYFPVRLVKILVAYKHFPKGGDKITGRHGNKGVISQVLPIQDMPFISDGTPLDIVLNPIGISSRMNLGQVLEVHLGWASSFLGRKIFLMMKKASQDSYFFDIKSYLYHLYKNTKERSFISKLSNQEISQLANKLSRATLISTSSFIGASEKDIYHYMQLANINLRGQTTLYDGKTGEKYDHPVTVGYMYILKLNHLVDEKIHTRFTGPYHRITEQPLGGKSRNGGQRFGEMEIWALQAYGAAYTLVDMVTFKSDLKRMHGFPEAFNVLIRELLALGFGIHGRV